MATASRPVNFQKHALVAIGGSWVYTDMPSEQWQFGIRVTTGGGHGYWLSNPATYLAAIGPNIVSWFSNSSNMMRTDCVLKYVKCNNIKEDGHYKDTTTNIFTTSTAGVVAPSNQPSFVTMAVTLETGNTSGRAKRGRIYPPFKVSLASVRSATVAALDRDTYRTAVKSLLTILTIGEPTGGWLVTPVVCSAIDQTMNLVNGVSCNDVVDVQRRRKARATGTRSTVAAFP